MRSNTDFGGKLITKWERKKIKRSHSLMCSYHSHPITISLSNLAPTPMGILREGWEFHFPFLCTSLM